MTSRPGRVPPFVCLHGFTGTPDAFRRLELNPLWAPPLTGHGPDPDMSSQHFDDEVQRIGAGIAGRAPEPVHLVGYSMGARVALGLLCSFPHLFARATLVGVNPGLSSNKARQDRLDWESRWIDVLERDGLAAFEHQWSAQPIFKTQLSVPPGSQDSQRRARLSHTKSGLVHALHVLGLGSMPNFWPRLESIKTPLTFVYGDRDEKFSAIAARASGLYPKIGSVAIPRVGHNPFLEAPDALARLLLSPLSSSRR